MKKCPYCGKEYPDDATSCIIDGELLSGDSPQLTVADEPAGEVTPRKDEPYLTFPDYQWSAKDAWKCIGVIVVFEFIIEGLFFAVNLHSPMFRRWYASGVGHFLTGVLHFSIYALTAAYFARTEKLTTFLKGFGFDCKPSNYVWFGIVMALVIRLFGHFWLAHGWGNGVSNYEMREFDHTLGFERYFFLLPPLLLAPLFEESLNRGFLFRAFRKSYSLGTSMILIVVWTAFTHWPYYSHSLLAAFCLSLITVVQCYLREKSDSLWDCILCHFTFNVSLLFVSPLK